MPTRPRRSRKSGPQRALATMRRTRRLPNVGVDGHYQGGVAEAIGVDFGQSQTEPVEGFRLPIPFLNSNFPILCLDAVQDVVDHALAGAHSLKSLSLYL